MLQQQPKRRKKRPIHGGLRAVEVTRGKNGYGFTISGQQPCILSCIVSGSPADRAGLKTGDFLISVNGLNISGAPHDDVVRLIGSSSGVLALQIAENSHSSDSSDNEMHAKPSKAKFPPPPSHHRRPQHRHPPGKAIGRSMEELGGGGGHMEPRHEQPMSNKYGHIMNRRRGAGGDNSFEQAKMRSFSPGRELDRHYAYEDQRQYRSMGIENLDPYAGEPYQARRTRHTSTGPHRQGVAHRSNNRHTKHTIITREHRLGLAKSMGVTETYATLPKAGSKHTSHLGHSQVRDLSSSSSSSNNTYLPMNAATMPRLHPDAHVLPGNKLHHLHQSTTVTTTTPSQQDTLDEEESSLLLLEIPGNLRVIVGYVGSIEMPREAKVNTRLQSIRSAVRRLQVERKVHTMVLMVISLEGVTLVNTLGNTVAVYPSDKVAFSGVNPDDKRFFGIMTFHGFVDEDPDVISGGACHVFMVDPELSLHSMHANKAKNFGIQCTLNEETQQCMEFPKSATLAVKCISRLYQSRPGGAYENGMAHLSSFEQPLNRPGGGGRVDGNSSNTTDSGIVTTGGGARERLSAVSQVCVVDVSSTLETASPAPNLETSGTSTIKSEQSLRWGLSGNSVFKTPPGVFKAPGETSGSVDEGDSQQHPSMLSLDRQSSSIGGGGQTPDMSTASVTSQDQSELSGSSDKLNVRAMPNPKGFNNMTNKSDSWNDLLADQNSADNLRRSMQRFLQTRQKPLESGSDIDSIKSQEDASPSSPHLVDNTHQGGPTEEESPVPPLPPRNMMRNPSGSSMGYSDQNNKDASSTTNSNQTDSTSSSVSGKLVKPRPGPADYKPMTTPTVYIRPPSPPASSTSSQHLQTVIARPKAERYPTSKPPLPDSARTPARPLRPPMERPKSTPPIRMAGSLDMDIDDDEEEYDSDPGNLSAFMGETGDGKESNWDNGSTGGGGLTEVAKPQPKSFWGKTGLFKGKEKKEKEKTPSKAITKSGSFKQSRGFRTPKFKQSQSLNPSRCGSTESLVVKDAEIPGEKNLGGATSVTVITQNGVLSYQESGSTTIGRAAGWAVNFDRLLRDKSGLATFTEFLKKEFSEENIIFWKKCEEYKKIPTQKERKLRAQELFRCHVETGASDPVNVDSQARSITAEGLEVAAPELFDVAKKQIFQLMKQDSYTRFLKSEIYKDCVRAEIDGKPLPYPPQDENEAPQTNGHAGGGGEGKKAKDERKSLKKSSSTTEDGGTEKRRRSLLPWGKKDKLARLMPKVMTDSDLRKNPRKDERSLSSGPGKMSLDLADLNALQKEIKTIERETAKASETQKEVAQKFCRVVFPDGSTTVFYAKPGQSVRSVLTKLCDKRNLDVEAVDVYNNTTDKMLSLQMDASQIGSKEIQLEMRVMFRLDLPTRQSLGVKGRPSRPLRQVLASVLNRYGVKTDGLVLYQAGGSEPVSLDTAVKEVDRQTLVIHPTTDAQVKRRKSKEWGSLSSKSTKPPLPRMSSEPGRLSSIPTATEEAQTQVFHSLFEGDTQLNTMFDEDGVFDPDKKGEPSVREEARASGLFSNILRKNSLDGKETANSNKDKGRRAVKPGKPVAASNSNASTTSGTSGGGGGLTGSTSAASQKGGNKMEQKDDLKVFSLLSKVSAQFDDQRGPLRKEDLELPDFLKPKRGSSLEEFPLRRNEMHSSDTSLYDGPMDRPDSLNRSRKLSNSEENLDNLLLKQYRRSTRGKGSYTGSSVTPGKIPFMDQSFSQDGVMPSHIEAEDYFSTMERPYSPDFNDSRIMEKSLVDIGMYSVKNSKQESSGFKAPATPSKAAKVKVEQSGTRTGSDPPTPVPKPRKSLSKRRQQALLTRQSDVESTCSEVSQTSSEPHTLYSDDLNDTLLPPSVSENSDSSSSSVPRKLSEHKMYVSKHGHVLSPKRPLRTSKHKLVHTNTTTSSSSPSKNSHGQMENSSTNSSRTHHSQVTTTNTNTNITSKSRGTDQDFSSQGSESDGIPYDLPVRPSSRSTTPSPTTHDLVLFADSSAEDSAELSVDGSGGHLPIPKRRSSLLKMQRSFGEGSPRRGAGDGGGEVHNRLNNGMISNNKGGEGDQVESEEDVQISFV